MHVWHVHLHDSYINFDILTIALPNYGIDKSERIFSMALHTKNFKKGSTTTFRILLALYQKNACRIERLSAKMADFAPIMRLDKKMLLKLREWTNQIISLRDKELDVISRITEIEEKHATMRKKDLLPRAGKKIQQAPEPTRFDQKKRRGGLLFVLLAILMMDEDKKRRMQTLKNG